MTPVTIVCPYFQSLTLANLSAALYAVRRQDLSAVQALVLVDNDSADSPKAIEDLVDALAFPMPTRILSWKHGDTTRTHAWSSNIAVRAASTPWILFTRADYLLDFDLLRRCAAIVDAQPDDWDGFVTSNGCHLVADIVQCEQTDWRARGPRVFRGFHGATFDYTTIDAGVWMARREAFDRVGGLDESLSAWGHAQTEFQYRLHQSGTAFVRIPETLFWHPWHAAQRDLELAHAQLLAKGVDLHALWARYEGASPY